MQHPRTAKPAPARREEPVSKVERLGSELDRSNTLKASEPQAPDDRGEDDWTFFRARPGAATRLRLPFPNEYPDDFMEYGGGVAFVRITVERDATGQPTRGARSLVFLYGRPRMTAYALITGVIFRAPTQRTAKSGKPYTSCTVKVGADDTGADFWSVLIFSESAQLEMLRLEIGDAVSVRGKMKLEIFEKDGQAKISRSIFADAALGLRPAPREKKPKKAAGDASAKETAAGGPAFFSDDIPFEAAR